METSIVTIKGQVVIPSKLRKKVGIKMGTRVLIEEKNGDIVIHPATERFYENTFCILKGGKLTWTLVNVTSGEISPLFSGFEFPFFDGRWCSPLSGSFFGIR